MGMRRVRAGLWLALLVCGGAGLAATALADTPPVLVVPIHGTVDDGMAHLVARAVERANAGDARAIVLDVDSNGGLLPAAQEMRDALLSAHEPVVAYVDPRAYSAAALIALAANRIVMAPAASIGAARAAAADPQYVSELRSEFEATASRNHRDPHVAAAIVDDSVDLPQYKATGTVLTLDADEAVRAGIADGIAPTLDDALAQSHLAGAPRVAETYSLGERLARFATIPIVSGLLLALGMLGLLIEMQTLHGVAGTVGVLALALFFGSHVYAGFSNGAVIALALLGLGGILWELHVVPGHGIPGIAGGVCLVAAAILAFGLPFLFVAVETLATAIVLTAICFTLFTRAVPQNAWAARLALASSQGPEYVTSDDHSALLGKLGTAGTFLRPAGIANIDDQRIDVLTEGEFIARGTPIRVVRVEGARVFVEAVTLPDYRA
ncbi:MAG TPA: NfeD family protein [Candidatus Acidoferrales bacterium]|nr:NfeD family protein [Candidatus Acidoferrales bacterium]